MAVLTHCEIVCGDFALLKVMGLLDTMGGSLEVNRDEQPQLRRGKSEGIPRACSDPLRLQDLGDKNNLKPASRVSLVLLKSSSSR